MNKELLVAKCDIFGLSRTAWDRQTGGGSRDLSKAEVPLCFGGGADHDESRRYR